MKSRANSATQRKPRQFGLNTLLVFVWLVAALLALARGVTWPSVLSGLGIILAIDAALGRDRARLRSPWVVLLLGVGSLFLVAVLLLWLSTMEAKAH